MDRNVKLDLYILLLEAIGEGQTIFPKTAFWDRNLCFYLLSVGFTALLLFWSQLSLVCLQMVQIAAARVLAEPQKWDPPHSGFPSPAAGTVYSSV